MNAGNTTSSENTSVEVQSKHSQSSILYLSEGQNSGCQMSGSVIHIYKERLLINGLAQEFSTIGFLYLSKGLEFRLSGDGDYDSSHYKESIPFYFWLTVIGWLGVDLTGTVSVNAPLFGHIYIPWVNSQH